MVQTSKGRDWYTVEINTAASMDVTFVCVHTALVHRTRDFPFSRKRRHCTDCFVPYLHTKPLRPELMLSGFSAFSAMLYAVLFQDTGLELPHWEEGRTARAGEADLALCVSLPLASCVPQGTLPPSPPRLSCGPESRQHLTPVCSGLPVGFLCLSNLFSLSLISPPTSFSVCFWLVPCQRAFPAGSEFSVAAWASAILNFIDSLGISSPVQPQGML